MKWLYLWDMQIETPNSNVERLLSEPATFRFGSGVRIRQS